MLKIITVEAQSEASGVGRPSANVYGVDKVAGDIRTWNEERETGNEHGEWKNKNHENKKTEWVMKLLIGLGITWDFVPILHFLFPRARFPFPFLSFSDIMELVILRSRSPIVYHTIAACLITWWL